MSGYEMRIYHITPGKMPNIQAVMREVMAPLMLEYRIEPLGFWATADDTAIHWFCRHESDDVIASDWDRFHADPQWKQAMAERTKGEPFISGETSTPMKGIDGLPPFLEAQNLATVGAYAKGLFAERNPDAVDWYVSSDFLNHSPEAPAGPDGVKGFVRHLFGEHPGASVEPKRMVATEDLVWVHSLLKTDPDDRGTAVVDIFRLLEGKIAEHWDVTQPIPKQTASGNPMI